MDTHIQAHLRHVVRALRVAEPPATAPADRRAALLDVLDAYAEAGRFPRWDAPITSRPRRSTPPRSFDGPGARAPRFRDPDGTWCAVGHLMAASDPALADALAERFEPCWLDEIDDPRVPTWAARHGFTADELAWIQPGYCWTPPVCDELTVEEPAPPNETTCEGADPRFESGYGSSPFCQTCDGPFRVWANVGNPGSEAAEVSVELWGTDGSALDRVDGVQIPAGQTVQVELTTASVEDVGTWGGLRLVAVADCDPDGTELTVWDDGNGGPGWVLPDECGGGCDTGTPTPTTTDTAATDTSSPEPDPDDGCGCATTGGAPWAALLAAGALARRRRAR